MGLLAQMVCISLLKLSSVKTYKVSTSPVCFSPVVKTDTCSLSDTPRFPLFESRMADQVQLYKPDNAKPHHIDFESRSYNYFSDDDQKNPQLLKNINIGYLNKDSISSIGDLIKMDSEEIGAPQEQTQAPEVSKAWQIDDVRGLKTPQYLPDVVLGESNYGNDQPRKDPYDHILSDDEKKLGRFVVRDEPPPIQDELRLENSLLTREVADMDNVEIEQRELRPVMPRRFVAPPPRRYNRVPPSIVLDNVVRAPPVRTQRYRLPQAKIQLEPMINFESKEETIEKTFDQNTLVTEAPEVVQPKVEMTTTTTTKAPETTTKASLDINSLLTSPEFLNVIQQIVKATRTVSDEGKSESEKRKKKKKSRKNKSSVESTTKNSIKSRIIEDKSDNALSEEDSQSVTEEETIKEDEPKTPAVHDTKIATDPKSSKQNQEIKPKKIHDSISDVDAAVLNNKDSVLDQVLSVM